MVDASTGEVTEMIIEALHEAMDPAPAAKKSLFSAVEYARVVGRAKARVEKGLYHLHEDGSVTQPGSEGAVYTSRTGGTDEERCTCKHMARNLLQAKAEAEGKQGLAGYPGKRCKHYAVAMHATGAMSIFDVYEKLTPALKAKADEAFKIETEWCVKYLAAAHKTVAAKRTPVAAVAPGHVVAKPLSNKMMAIRVMAKPGFFVDEERHTRWTYKIGEMSNEEADIWAKMLHTKADGTCTVNTVFVAVDRKWGETLSPLPIN
jgi:hypothetical protein